MEDHTYVFVELRQGEEVVVGDGLAGVRGRPDDLAGAVLGGIFRRRRWRRDRVRRGDKPGYQGGEQEERTGSKHLHKLTRWPLLMLVDP